MVAEEDSSFRAELLASDGVQAELDRNSSIALFGMLGETPEAGQQELLYRVLRACENNVPKAAHVLKTILSWRAEQGLPEILADEDRIALFKKAEPYWPVGLGAYPSQDGCVLEVWRVGQFWPTEMLASFSEDELRKVWLMHMERGLEKQAEARETLGLSSVKGVILVFDLAGMAMRHLNTAGLSQLKEVLGWSQRYYVENVRSIFVINAGVIFETAWVVIKQVLHPNTVKKVSVHADSAVEVLASTMGSIDKIPTFLGGTDEKTTIGSRARICADEVTIKAGDQYVITVEVTDEIDKSDVLEVNFESQDYDMNFGAFWYPAPKFNKEHELISVKKYNSHIAPERLELSNPGPGKIKLAFDNEDSSFYGKKVWIQHTWKGKAPG